MTKLGMILGAIGAAFIVAILTLYAYINAVRNDGIAIETRLSAQYQSNQNNLSAFISGFYEQLGVANLKSEKLDQILTDAVKGRYESSGGFSAKGAFFSAISEAYPDLSGLAIYDKLSTYVAAGRTSYRDVQDKLLDMLRAYDLWQGTGFVRSMVVRAMGFPSERLEARLPGKIARGKEARDQMYIIVLASEAAKAYETGKMEPLKVK